MKANGGAVVVSVRFVAKMLLILADDVCNLREQGASEMRHGGVKDFF